MKRAVTALLLALPTIAAAEGPPGQNYSFFASFLQMIAALSIVVGLILLTRHFSARLMGGSVSRLSSKHIRLVETRYISPKKSLLLVEVGGEYMLLANSDDRIVLLKKVDILEEIEVVEDGTGPESGFWSMLRRKAGGRNN